LKDHFAKPLRKLSVKDHGPLAVSENGLEPKKIWQALVSSYNKDGSVISDEKYWKDTFDSTDFAIKNTKRFANEMAKL
jgi:hypothetical protein